MFPSVFHVILMQTQNLILVHSAWNAQKPRQTIGLHALEESTHVSMHSLAQMLICSFIPHVSYMVTMTLA